MGELAAAVEPPPSTCDGSVANELALLKRFATADQNAPCVEEVWQCNPGCQSSTDGRSPADPQPQNKHESGVHQDASSIGREDADTATVPKATLCQFVVSSGILSDDQVQQATSEGCTT